MPSNRSLRLKPLSSKLGLSLMTIHRYLRDERYSHLGFPRPRYVGRTPLWSEAEIDAWLESLPRKSA